MGAEPVKDVNRRRGGASRIRLAAAACSARSLRRRRLTESGRRGSFPSHVLVLHSAELARILTLESMEWRLFVPRDPKERCRETECDERHSLIVRAMLF